MASPELPPSDKVAEEGPKNVADEVTDKATENEADKTTDPTAEATTDSTTDTTTDTTKDPATATTTDPVTKELINAASAVQVIKKILQRPKSKSASPPPKDQAPAADGRCSEEPTVKPGLLDTLCSKLPSGNSSSCPRCNADGALGDCKVCGWNGGFGGDS